MPVATAVVIYGCWCNICSNFCEDDYENSGCIKSEEFLLSSETIEFQGESCTMELLDWLDSIRNYKLTLVQIGDLLQCKLVYTSKNSHYLELLEPDPIKRMGRFFERCGRGLYEVFRHYPGMTGENHEVYNSG
jgi:hypothetical protein